MIERELAKEIGLLRETHSKSLQGTDGNVINHVFLGKVGKDFVFSDLKAKVLIRIINLIAIGFWKCPGA